MHITSQIMNILTWTGQLGSPVFKSHVLYVMTGFFVSPDVHCFMFAHVLDFALVSVLLS